MVRLQTKPKYCSEERYQESVGVFSGLSDTAICSHFDFQGHFLLFLAEKTIQSWPVFRVKNNVRTIPDQQNQME